MFVPALGRMDTVPQPLWRREDRASGELIEILPNEMIFRDSRNNEYKAIVGLGIIVLFNLSINNVHTLSLIV